jgi:hypothetical protein
MLVISAMLIELPACSARPAKTLAAQFAEATTLNRPGCNRR